MSNILKRKVLPIVLMAAIVLCSLLGGSLFAEKAPETENTVVTPPPLATPQAQQPPEPELTPAGVSFAPETFIISMVGDCTIATVPGYHDSPYAYEAIVGDDYAYPFAKTLSYFAQDDFTFVNLESCFTTSEAAVSKTFVFKADPVYAAILSEGSVEFATLANNHILDYGEQGLSDTKAALDVIGVSYVGRNEYTVYETDRGLKIGIYAVSFGTVAQIEAGIAALRELDVDFIIAAIHWGDEGSYTPNADQISQGRAAIDAGADIVYGSHPHTLQPFEEYEGSRIYYSMGNWTFGGNTNPRDKDTFILQLELTRDESGNVTISKYIHIPCASSGETAFNNYQPVPYKQGSEDYLRVLSKLDGSFSGSALSIGYDYTANE